MFRIGEFSKIAQVSGRLLRYYDEIGLLSPEYTDPQTGYRYYSAKQLSHLNRVLVLKDLGLSLEQVARLLDQNISTDEIKGMLTLRKAQIERVVEEEMIRFRDIESRLKQLDTHGYIQEPDVILKEVPAQGYLALREVFAVMPNIRRLVEKMNSEVPNMISKSHLGYITVIVHSPMFEPEALDFEVGYVLDAKIDNPVRLSDDRILTYRELPAVPLMATVIQVGRVENSHRSYEALGKWIEANDYLIAGSGREVLMQLPLPGKENEAVIDIQLPIMKREQAKISS